MLKPGGRFLCLEFSECQVPILDRLYDFHSFEVIPRLGKLTAGQLNPIAISLRVFDAFQTRKPSPASSEAPDFDRVSYRNLTGGIAAIHSGWKI